MSFVVVAVIWLLVFVAISLVHPVLAVISIVDVVGTVDIIVAIFYGCYC